MKIELLDLTIRDLVAGYRDDGEGGVVGYGGRLDIRPPFQREFSYDDKERAAVIDSILKGYPLNIMYWAERGDGSYEIIDGQQRTIAIAQYVAGAFPVAYPSLAEPLTFHQLPADLERRILDYPLMVYVCSGTGREKLAWFQTINIAGQKLTDQEMRNAAYAGPWVTDAKRYFSRSGCAAYQIGRDYLSGVVKRQDYLETAIGWISGNQREDYMGQHQDDENAAALWHYFRAVIAWIEATFTNLESNRKSLMKGLDWGRLYNEYQDARLDPDAIEAELTQLMRDDEVQHKSGIYEYVLSGDERHLFLRAFDLGTKQRVYEKQAGRCAICKEHFEFHEMVADRITPWSEGGKAIAENCQMVSRKCYREKYAGSSR